MDSKLIKCILFFFLSQTTIYSILTIMVTTCQQYNVYIKYRDVLSMYILSFIKRLLIRTTSDIRKSA